MPKVVSDTSPLQYLHQAECLDLLRRLYSEILIPEGVAEEIAEGRSLGYSLPDRPLRFRFQVDAPHGSQATLHLMHDSYPVGQVRRGVAQSDQLPLILTALANLRVQPEALAQFLLAVPDGVLRRCGVILARVAGEEG